MAEDRQQKVARLNALTRELKALSARLEKMEAHEGEDGTAENIDGQCALVEEIAAKQREARELRREVYPK